MSSHVSQNEKVSNQLASNNIKNIGGSLINQYKLIAKNKRINSQKHKKINNQINNKNK